MIRNLRKKFIFITMLSLLCITFVLITAINTVNFVRIDRHSDALLDMILSQGKRDDMPPPDGELGEDGGKHRDEPLDKKDKYGGFSFSPETAYTTRWFSVTFSQDSATVFMDRIASVTEEEALALSERVLRSERESGYRESYKYRVVSDGKTQTETVYFLSVHDQLQSGFFLLIATVLIALICLIILFVLITLLSRRVVKPVLENYERQKRFITDAGHELKTPISIISANADVLSVTGNGNEWVDGIRKQTERMDHLVCDLLTLAKSEESAERSWVEFDLSEAVADTAGSFESIARSRGKTLCVSVEEGITYRGDEGALRRLVSILMENAMKYADGESEITLSLRRENRRIRLVQSNSATPLPTEDELARLFDRFYRVDPSRSRTSGGYGIGLSIARGIVESHRGRITAFVRDGRLHFSVVL